MCVSKSELKPSHLIYSRVHRQRLLKALNIRVHRLYRRRGRSEKEGRDKARVGMIKREMEIKNLKLFMQNQIIIQQNEKLKKRALQLHKENKALLSQIQNVAASHKPPS